jgi:hypothetical protein
MGKLNSRLGAALIMTAALMLSGCAGGAEPEPAATATVAAITASQIATIDDGIEWAQSLDDTVTATELSEGITAIGDLVPDLDIWFATNNELGRALIVLNGDVLDDPDTAGDKVDDLQSIVDDIEAAIEKGPNP